VSGDLPARAPRILLIEDNPADVYLVREVLAAHHIAAEFHSIDDGEKALEMLDRMEQDPGPLAMDLVLLDLNLPRCDGMQVLARIAAGARLSTIPVIVLTSSDSPRDKERVLSLGAVALVRKSSTLAEFMLLGGEIRKVLDARGH
jgi:CheY-like chemotaxis protein